MKLQKKCLRIMITNYIKWRQQTMRAGYLTERRPINSPAFFNASFTILVLLSSP